MGDGELAHITRLGSGHVAEIPIYATLFQRRGKSSGERRALRARIGALVRLWDSIRCPIRRSTAT